MMNAQHTQRAHVVEDTRFAVTMFNVVNPFRQDGEPEVAFECFACAQNAADVVNQENGS